MCCSPRLGLARRLLASSVSLAVVLSSFAFAIASPAKPATKADSPSNELTLTSSSATATRAGVLLRWTTNSVPDNVGFNVYRLKDGRRTRANKEIIPGALFAPGTPVQRRAGYSYSWFDRGGSADSTYLIESVNVDGAARMHNAIVPVSGKSVSEFDQASEAAGPAANESADTFEKRYPAEQAQQTALAPASIETQWEIAAQTALKISINKDGWYRVTQPQMVAAGFNPVVDIRNLQLFVDANEVAINTNQLSGQFGSSDYIEFYGSGLDTPTTDKHIYYLIAGNTPGKRVIGGIQLDGDPPPPPPGPSSTPPVPVSSPPVTDLPGTTTAPVSTRGPTLSDPIFYSWAQNNLSYLTNSLELRNAPDKRETKERAVSNPALAGLDAGTPPADYARPGGVDSVASDSLAAKYEQQSTTNNRDLNATDSIPLTSPPAAVSPAPRLALPRPAFKAAARQQRKRSRARKRTRRTLKRQPKEEHSHAPVAAAAGLPNYNYTLQIKEKFVYFSSLLNGDQDNFFGRVISGSPVTQTLMVSNPDLAAAGPATVEFALQGVLNPSGTSHSISVSFNGVTIGSLDFSPLEHPVRTFSVPIALVQNGNNSLTFTKTSTGEVCIVDYIRFTYPHTFKADANSLKFNLRGTQTVKVDGFSTPSVRLIDYTDPLNVRISKPASETSAMGYAITVPASESRSKLQRLLYAFPQGQFDQPAALSLGQPSNLNQGDLSPTITSGADFLIIAHKNFIASLAPLVSKRQSEGRLAAVVDVDDIYDEFSYGAHGPQAIKDFLSHTLTSTNWVSKPLYIIFAGDASLDPRNYQGLGDFDFVPTKLVDATFSETASDDWVADFHGGPNDSPDGIADIPVGRLPLRSVADANLVVSKIVNFAPQPQPQSAMLVADEDEFNAFGFATTNDVFQSLLPASMTVQRLNRAPQPQGVPSQALTKADIVNGFNAGPALVSYSGHGNVDFWTGALLFTSADATALTNGTNKLSFVVVMDCLNGYFQDPTLLSLSEALVKAPNGGAVATFASSGLTIAQGQHQMGEELYTQLYSGSPMAVGDAIKIAKGATFDIDVKRTWIFFGDPSLKIR
ncbi:MAG TPA: C25 family cysteine peptidase [Pyrinomonadaceae bacterium]|nr:C25 family cysteine peptidase [Pyrinomonadaceae bacterium]